MKEYTPLFLLRTKLQEIKFQSIAISDFDSLGLRQKLFALTRSPFLFGHHPELERLSLIHAHFGPDGVYAMSLADKLKIPFLVTFHGSDITRSHRSLLRSMKPSAYHFLWSEKKLKNKSAAFIAVSHFIKTKLIENGYPKEKIIQHYIGVDTQKLIPGEGNNKEQYILNVARHFPVKGLDTLLRAFAIASKKHNNISLIQVGAGPLSVQLLKLTEELGIQERVRFLGAQPHNQVIELMRDATIFVLSSQKTIDGSEEGLSIVLNEASACGVPVIATLSGGIPEVVLDGKTGFLVPEKDHNIMAEKIDILLSNKTLSKEMGKCGRDYVCEVFDIRKQTAKLENIYAPLIRKIMWKKA
jgi:glycosyltransferase involved in cell wall biosynthesis